jgi:two-component system KDP operon response regulator KdpE
VIYPRQLLQEAWGPEYPGEGDYIRTYITRLRKKLEVDSRDPRYILTERGLGYCLVEADPSEE